MSTAEKVPTKVITGVVRLSYPHLFEPTSMEEGGDKTYSCNLIIPKTDKATIKAIEAAIDAAKELGKAKFGGKIPANLKIPLSDGDTERPEDEAYANSFFIKAKSRARPGVVDSAVKPIMDQEEVYAGCYVRASINLFPFNTAGNKGVACGLNHIMKIKDGENLSGRLSAYQDFAGIAEEDLD